MAGMTLTEKIFAAHSGNDRVSPGMTVWVTADLLMTHDVCGPGTIGILHKEIGPQARVWDPDRVVIIPDHFIFTEDQDARRNLEALRVFVKEQGIRHFYDAGTDRYSGVCHVTLAERGHLRPGESPPGFRSQRSGDLSQVGWNIFLRPVHVYTHPQYDESNPIAFGFHFGKDPGHFFSVHEDVVGPFEAGIQAGSPGQGIGPGHPRKKRDLRG